MSVELETPTASVFERVSVRVRTPRRRTMAEFAEQEIVIPDGPYEGRRFRWNRLPYSRLWFAAIDSGQWRRFVATGPQQSGKTLQCFVIPLLYHLFELEQTVVCGVPSLDMVADKWNEDILPTLTRTRYRNYLPKFGPGSRGGNVVRVTFKNGRTLRFMTGGGGGPRGDKSRAGFTAPVVIITETDGMDESGGRSREADKVTQLEGRNRAGGRNARTYMECTLTTEEGRTWREYTAGTMSEIALRCPRCKRYSVMGRPNLVGWQQAQDILGAIEGGQFQCPECKALWDEEERAKANLEGLLIHRGQEVTPAGKIIGSLPRTNTLGFRWGAANNLLVQSGDIAADEWRGARAPDEENAEKELMQFVWALPYKSNEEEVTELNAAMVTRRIGTAGRGEIPDEMQYVTAAADLGLRLCHWIVVAWAGDATGQVIDYGRTEVPSDDMGIERALMVGLRDFRDICQKGWPRQSKMVSPGMVLVDSGGTWTPTVYQFCRESGDPFQSSKGYGTTQDVATRRYRGVKKTGSVVRRIGPGYHVSRLKRKPGSRTWRVDLVEVDVDYWKSWLQARLRTPQGEAGALMLYAAQPREHLSLAKHLTAERERVQYIGGRGYVQTWERVNRNNHWLDAATLAAVGAHLVGVRLIGGGEEDTGPRAATGGSWFANRNRR